MNLGNVTSLLSSGVQFLGAVLAGRICISLEMRRDAVWPLVARS